MATVFLKISHHLRTPFILLTLFAIIFVVCDERSLRVKRKLVFLKGTKFFCRYNIKENVFPHTTRLAWAIGLKLTWELPVEPKVFHRFRFKRRAIYEDVEEAFLQHGMNGRACVERALCEAAYSTTSPDMFTRILKHVFTIPETERADVHPYSLKDDCESLADICAISLFQYLAMSQLEMGDYGDYDG